MECPSSLQSRRIGNRDSPRHHSRDIPYRLRAPCNLHRKSMAPQIQHRRVVRVFRMGQALPEATRAKARSVGKQEEVVAVEQELGELMADVSAAVPVEMAASAETAAT
mmetsp:Transcript_32164/g.84307  ORF Transcript_32164/g.84307 Transcript_32164/m.84307 type:complete len:108 (-) Transcript_32164:84-407(-)